MSHSHGEDSLQNTECCGNCNEVADLDTECCGRGCCAEADLETECCGGCCEDNECYEGDCCGEEEYDEEIQVGGVVPFVELEGYFKGEKKVFSFDDYPDKWIVLFFYPLDFTFVCPTELLELSKKHKEFEKINAQVLGVSIDSVFSHEAWSKELGDLNFPLLSDVTKFTSMDYNVLIEDQGIALRGTFIISPEGVLKSMQINDLDIGRNVDEILRTIQALQTGELCPVNWTPGKKTLGNA